MPNDRPQQSEAIDHEAARRNARFIGLIVAVAVLVGAVAALAADIGDWGHGHHHDRVVAVLIFVAVLVVTLAIVVPLTLRLFRRSHYSRVLQFGWGQRRRVGKALRNGGPIAPQDRPVADALVRTMRQQRWLPYLFGVLLLFYAAQAVFDHGYQRWLAIVLVALYILVIPYMLWQRHTILGYDRLEKSGGASTP